MTSAMSRTPYVGQTPDVGTFGAYSTASSSIPLARFDDSEVDDSDDFAARAADDHQDLSAQDGLRGQWNMFTSQCKAVYTNNIGLLLVAISVAFASMMSTLVKLMNSIDPPVPMLEVILSHYVCSG